MTTRLLASSMAAFLAAAAPALAQRAYAPLQANQAAPQPLPFAKAAGKAVREMLDAAAKREGGAREIVIDPLLDGATGLHTVAAAGMGRMISDIVRHDYAHRFKVVDISAEALARKPLVVMGSITALQTPAPAGQRPLAVWVTMADTGNNEVVAKGNARALPAGVDTRPTPDQADAPMWRKDEAVAAYLDSCRNLKVGETLRADYAQQLTAAALLASGGRAYGAHRYAEALALYQKALAAPGGRQTRTLSGIYLALAKLKRGKEAADAFGQLVEYGLEKRDISVKFLFRPGAAQFASGPLTAPYPMWLDRIAGITEARNACLEVVGHTSPTGPAAVNERLSLLRAELIRNRLDGARHGLGKRLIARGVGSAENLVGTGRDDASDALDRRVELKVLGCG